MAPPVLYVAVTDNSWFDFLAACTPQLDEVNFWSPGGRLLDASRGTPFLFKLKAPRNVIGGGGFIDYSQRLSVKDAWEFYGTKNGAATAHDFEQLISRYLRRAARPEDVIACTIISEPFFFKASQDVAAPEDWKSQIVSSKKYKFSDPIALRLFRDVQLRTGRAIPTQLSSFGGVAAPSLHIPRRGQGTFRRLVISAYDGQCAVTGEHTVPVLQASHIKPFAERLEHEIQNGIALRSDIHTLFDRGYVTITSDHRFLVSGALKDDFANGRVYYTHNGQVIHVPTRAEDRPRAEYLEWHGDTIFKG